MNDPVFTFQFTINQVNNILDLMNLGPYGRVLAVINEFQRQIKAQQPPETPPPKANGEAQAAITGETRQ